MSRITINAVAFQKGSLWIAQCLEYDLVSCAETPEELLEELVGQLEALVEFNLTARQHPFEGYSPAPEKYWRLFEETKAKATPVQPRKSLISRLAGLWGRPVIMPRLFFAPA
ncbi:MAG TPA: hypothetical protein VKK31_23575 [Thermoanaerobaculia bacterium]|nr:hypothetical protein [Thermoanaerobaculia bacterium]